MIFLFEQNPAMDFNYMITKQIAFDSAYDSWEGG